MSVLIFGTLCDNYVFYSFSLNLIEFSHDVLIAFFVYSDICSTIHGTPSTSKELSTCVIHCCGILFHK